MNDDVIQNLVKLDEHELPKPQFAMAGVGKPRIGIIGTGKATPMVMEALRNRYDVVLLGYNPNDEQLKKCEAVIMNKKPKIETIMDSLGGLNSPTLGPLSGLRHRTKTKVSYCIYCGKEKNHNNSFCSSEHAKLYKDNKNDNNQ